MPITADKIDHLAKLARLKLSPVEKKKFSREISSILDYVNQLKEAGGAPVLKLETLVEPNLREDKIDGCSKEMAEKILENAPQKQGRLFKVKAVFDVR